MAELLLPILIFVAVMLIGAAVVVGITAAGRRAPIEPRLGPAPAAGGSPFTDTVEGPMTRAAGGVGRAVSPGTASDRLKEQLAKAGYYHDSSAANYMGAKVILLLVGGFGTAALLFPFEMGPLTRIYLICLVSAILFFLPNMFVRMQRRARSASIRNYLPDAIDLLEICVTAGMGLDMAWNAVSDEIRRVCPTLADEMALVNLEVQLGAPRTDAMRNMADRTGADDLASLVALLIQSDRFGTSISEALRTFASSMREARSVRAEEAAEKMAVKLLFPLVFFIFPVMLIVMVGPAAITLTKVMGGG